MDRLEALVDGADGGHTMPRPVSRDTGEFDDAAVEITDPLMIIRINRQFSRSLSPMQLSASR